MARRGGRRRQDAIVKSEGRAWWRIEGEGEGEGKLEDICYKEEVADM